MSDERDGRIEELERQVAQLAERHAAAARELEALVYAISHDLRAPLRSLSGFGQALAETLGTQDEKARHYLDRIQQGSRKLSQLIDALLELSRIARAEMHPRDLDFTQLCEDAMGVVAAKYPDQTVQPSIARNMRVLGDQRMLRLAVEALVDNALKFSAKRRNSEIEIGRTAQGEFFVRDHGAGFAMEYAEKLFRPFQRLHSDADFPGLGIGLAATQRIVTRHNGEIRLESAPEAGTTVFFSLNLAGERSARASK
jgi:light-regulated signal transduction histidine kinase (bacteriophytochrome)